jgi:putative transcriptional regulator
VGVIKMNRIKQVLAGKDVSQKELAVKVNRSAQSISRICNNQAQPSIELLREVAHALNVNVQELLEPTKVLPED